MAKNSKNYTFSLPMELMDKVKTYLEIHEGSSINSMVREAVEQYLVKLDKARLGMQMQKAASDPMFMEDLNASMIDFEIADNEALPKPTRK
jgi:predicted DNA-binding protein